MGSNTKQPFLAVALSAVLVLSGCIGSQTDDSLDASSAGSDVAVALSADEAGDVSQMGFELDRVLAHDANVSLPDGFHDLDPAADQVGIVQDGSTSTVDLASGTLTPGTYDQILIRLNNATVERSSGSGGHGHGGSDDGHNHDHGGSGDSKASKTSTGKLDIPVNATFEVVPGETTSLELVLDVGESVSDTGFAPTFAEVHVKQGNETVATVTDPSTPTTKKVTNVPQDPPAPRIAVFAPNGDQVYEPPFDPEDGAFANQLSSGFDVGKEVRFTGTESEAVAKGATIDAYEWEFGEGATDTGATASHAYDEPGVYEVTLTVTDTFGTQATHTVRVVTVGWTDTVAKAGFESGSEWANQSADADLNEWHLAGPGHASQQAWHVGIPTDLPVVPGYAPTVGDTAVTSSGVTLTTPEYQIPDNFRFVGYELVVNGSTTTGQLDVDVVVDGEAQDLTTITGEREWARLGGQDALGDVNGSTVQFTFTFSAPAGPDTVPEGPGYAIDDFKLAGMAEDALVNAELLPDGGHGGHDHSH